MTASSSPAKNVVLFHRDFQGFTGGHLKVWNYFNHVLASKSFEPRIAFTPGSKWDATNPWADSKDRLAEWRPEIADVLFLAGSDWKSLSPAILGDRERPIINLIQHTRHADPNDELYTFLTNRAVRICVSEPVAQAIKATGKVRGPVFVIPNGIALDDIPERTSHQEREIDVLICGLKVPDLANKIERRLANPNLTVASLIDWIPRTEYLERMNSVKMALTLPRPSEGFYLPAIEAMACGAIVVCPDCVGNRGFCEDEVNCFRPAYDEGEIIAAVQRATKLPAEESAEMRRQADATVADHSLERERASFLQVLDRVDEVWNE